MILISSESGFVRGRRDERQSRHEATYLFHLSYYKIDDYSEELEEQILDLPDTIAAR